jgi:thiol-disulfide isomerase/thioredoxin
MRRSLSLAVMVLSAAAAVMTAWQPAGIGFAAAQPIITFADAQGRPVDLDITFADAQGRPVDLDAFKGNVVILDFWATWCKPCRDEFPVLDRLQARLGPEGLIVVAVCVDHQGLPAVDAFYEQLKIVNLAKYTGNMNKIAKAFGLRGLPSTLVLDRDGREVVRIEGAAHLESAEIGTVLTRLLAR